MIYLLTAIGLTPGGSSTVPNYTQTIHRTTQLTTLVGRLSGIRTQSGQTNCEECGPCLVFASYTLAYDLQPRKKHGKTYMGCIYIYINKTWQSKKAIYYFLVEEKNCDIRRFDSDVIEDSDLGCTLSTIPGSHIPSAW
jgi:hypothetical protein